MNFLNIILFIIVVVLSKRCDSTTVSTTTLYVDSNSEYLAPSCGFFLDKACKTIHDAVYSFGNTTDTNTLLDIKMLGGTYYDFQFDKNQYPMLDISNSNISISPLITDNNSLEVIISGQYFQTKFLNITSNNLQATGLEINNITFKQFSDSIVYFVPKYNNVVANSFIFNNIKVSNCKIVHPLFYFDKATYSYSYYSLYMYPKVVVSNSIFINNAIIPVSNPSYSYSTLSKTSIFSVWQTNVTMENNLFEKNAITSLYSLSCRLCLSNLTFDSNSYASSIYTSSSKSISIVNCTFTKNLVHSGHTDGAAYYSSFDSNVLIDNSTFNENYASYGGSIYLSQSQSVIKNSKFTSNIATLTGGAIYLYQGESAISNIDFENNVASAGMTIGVYGTSVSVTGSNSYFTLPYPTIDAASPNIISLTGGASFYAFNFSVADFPYSPANGGSHFNIIDCTRSTFSLYSSTNLTTYNQFDNNAICSGCYYHSDNSFKYNIDYCHTIDPQSPHPKRLSVHGKVGLAFLVISSILLLIGVSLIIVTLVRKDPYAEYNLLHNQFRFATLINDSDSDFDSFL
ncbi:hypothetical protein CYY_008714 [Polysphondylium violaceum]|uniref:Right handed beta helix domain-containing protein n=1 Tax=Polysphondylium violaceum TaxID=133409 RepID=A0A8J4PPZ6_9MYCE|nr:hypothetical protein CYY_008714 [Polysphondylium violaceum]